MAENKEKRTVEIVMNGAQPQKTLKGLSQDIAILASNIRKLDPASDAFKQQAVKIQQLRKEYASLNKQVYDTSSTFDRFRRDALAFGAGSIFGNITANLTSYLADGARYMAETSDQLAQIRKTAGLSADQVDALNDSLQSIDSRTTKAALRDIAIGLGQMGVEANKANIESIDKIVVALGDEFKGGAQEITNALGILRNNLQDFQTDDFATDMLNLGNALNQLGATGMATAPVVTDFATRMSGVLQQFGVSTGQTLGLSAAMQELGVGVERGSTAVTKLVQKMAQNPNVFAKIAGAKTKEEIQDFIDLLNKDAVSALLKVAQGAKTAGNSNTEFAAIIKELEATGAGVSEVLGKLAANQQLVTDKINLSTAALKNNESINQEFALMNDTIAAKIEKLQNKVREFFAADFFNKALTSGINIAIVFVNALQKLGGWIERNAFFVKGLAAAYGVYLLSMSRAIIVQTAKLALDKAQAAAEVVLTATMGAYSLAVGVFTGRMSLATAAQATFNAVAKLNPYVFLASAIVGAGVALDGFIKKNRQATIELERTKIAMKYDKEIKAIADDVKADLDYLKANIDKFNKTELTAYTTGAVKAAQEKKKELEGAAEAYVKLAKAEDAQKQKLKELDNAFTLEKTYTKEKLQLEKISEERLGAAKKLEELKSATISYASTAQQLSDKLIAKNNEQATSAKEVSDKEKQYLDERIKMLEELRKAKQDYFDKVHQAQIDQIDDENAQALASLNFQKEIELRKADEELQSLLKSAVKLKQSEAEKQQIISGSEEIKLAIRKKYTEAADKLNQQSADAKQKAAYDDELKNLNDYIEGNKLAYAQLYAEGVTTKTAYEQAITAVDLDAKQRLVAIAQKYGLDVKKTEQDLANAIIAINEDKTEKLKAQLTQQAEAELRLAQLRLEAATQKGSFAQRNSAVNEMHNAEINALVTKFATEAGLTELNEEQILNIKKKYREEFDAIDRQFTENEVQLFSDAQVQKMDMAQQYMQAISQVINTIMQSVSDMFAQQLTQAQETYNADISELDKAKSKKILSEGDYNKKKEILDEQLAKKQRAIKRKQAIADKVTALFNIGLSTAMAVMNALATAPFPASIAFAAMAGTLGAIQLGFAAAKPIPAYGNGGILPNGPLHSSGGMNIIDRSGNPVANIEGGEPILSRQTYQNNKQIVDALLLSQGKSLSQIPSILGRVPSVNFASITGAQRTMTMAKGGFLPGATSSTALSVNNLDFAAAVNTMIASNNALMKKLEEPAMAVFDYDYFVKRKALLDAQQLMGNPGKS